MKRSIYIIVFLLVLSNCSVPSYVGPTYICKQKTPPFGNKFHVLRLDYANYFYYTYYDKSGLLNQEVNGEYEINQDTIIMKIIKPIDFKIKETFLKYSNFKSQDSVYFMFFDLYPEVLEINRHRYQKVSLSLFYDCPTDTCPSYQAIDSKLIPGWAFKDTVVVSKKFFDNNKLDTLDFFDPNDDLVDKKIPIKIDKFNCVKIYLAIKPKYDMYDIPTRFFFEKKHIVCFDSENNKMIFKPYHNNQLQHH